VGTGGAVTLPSCPVGQVSCNEGCLAQAGDEHAGCTAVHFADNPITSLAIDAGALYFATNGQGIRKLDLSTSTVTVVADPTSLPQTLVLGAVDLYYTTYASPGAVWRVPKAGGTPASLAPGIEWAAALALAGDTLYVLSGGGFRQMLRTVPVAGGNATPFVTVNVQSFLIDGPTVYYVDKGTTLNGKLIASPLADPTQTTELASSVFANRLASDATAVYWITSTDHGGGTTDHVYYRASKTGTSSEPLLQGSLDWAIVHQDSDTVYVRERYVFDKPGNADQQQRLLRMPVAAPSSATFATVEHTSIDAVVTDSSTVYVATGRAIMKLPK
jgi:hypothetical protein